jgi:hypothetical protein
MIYTLFIYVSRKEAISNSDYIASKGKTLKESFIGRDVEGSGHVRIRGNRSKSPGGKEQKH